MKKIIPVLLALALLAGCGQTAPLTEQEVLNAYDAVSQSDDPALLDRTVTAEPVDEDHWTITVTYWVDAVDHVQTPIPRSDDTTLTPVATVGYSQSVLDYEKTKDGWQFTNLDEDQLDLDADTVFQFSYGGEPLLKDEQSMENWSNFKVACWLLHADALSEGASSMLTERFLEDPASWFDALSVFPDSPWANAQTVIEAPAYDTYAWYSQEEQAQLEEILNTYQPKSDQEQALLNALSDARERAIQLTIDDATAAFCFKVDGQYLSLGSKEGAYPWGYSGFLEEPQFAWKGDNGELAYFFSYQGIDIHYLSFESTPDYICCMTATQPGPETLRGIQVGDTEEAVLAAYPEAVALDAVGERQMGADYAIVYEPGGWAFCKHISFFMKDDIVVAIEIQDLMDGRLLNE